MERKIIDLPDHPTKGKQRIVIELPAPESVWYLVIAPEKAIPLPALPTTDPKKKAITAKEILDTAMKQQGEDWVAWYVGNGFSLGVADFKA